MDGILPSSDMFCQRWDLLLRIRDDKRKSNEYHHIICIYRDLLSRIAVQQYSITAWIRCYDAVTRDAVKHDVEIAKGASSSGRTWGRGTLSRVAAGASHAFWRSGTVSRPWSSCVLQFTSPPTPCLRSPQLRIITRNFKFAYSFEAMTTVIAHDYYVQFLPCSLISRLNSADISFS